MVRNLVLVLGILGIGSQVFALDVVYPKTENVTINSPQTFFIGSSDSTIPLTINDISVDVHPSGGFAKTVPLNFGENIFTLKSGNEILTYTINRPENSVIKRLPNNSDLKIYETPKYLKVSKDNSPLRSTPVDEGINRLSHLQAGIPLIADAEKNGFYRIMLGENVYGWIMKSHVDYFEGEISKVSVLGVGVDGDDEFLYYTFHLSAQTPWAIEETAEKFKISLYNISSGENSRYDVDLPISSIMGGKKLIGYSAYFSGNDFIVKIRRTLPSTYAHPLDNVIIAIDAGHGGSEIGAIGCLGTPEKSITLQYAKELSTELKSRGANVVLIRDKDEDINLSERVEIANKANSVILISLHGNALPDSLDPEKIKGAEIYYYYPQTKPLAESIMNSITLETDNLNHGIIQRSFAMVRNSNALSLLIELGYLINPDDNAKILNKKFRKNTVKAIADGIEKYLKTQLEKT